MSRWDIGTRYDTLYKSFFDRSEANRRWRLDRDIAWDDRAPSVPEELVSAAETFYAVESFLPDYTSTIAANFRSDRARVWLHAMWAYEESKHGRAFEEWLLRGGHRTEDDLNELSAKMWAGHYQMPHTNDRRMLIYQALQEAFTAFVYRGFRKRAEVVGDRALVDVLRYLAADEQAHYSFFRDATKLWLEDDPEGTLEDIYAVLMGFSMPAGDFIPDYPARAALIDKLDIASPYLFITKVWPSVAASLGINLAPPALRPLLESGMTIEEVATMLVSSGAIEG